MKKLEHPNLVNLEEVVWKEDEEMKKPEVAEFFGKLIQRLTPKSWPQAIGEPTVTRKWLEVSSTGYHRS